MFLGWPLSGQKQKHFESWAIFNAFRDYDKDGIFDDKHEGLDFHAEIGDPVLACLDGKVVHISDGTTAYGNYIIVEHDDDWVTWYAHLTVTLKAVGDFVKRGQTIGSAGSTGNSTGPHLHLTVQHRGHGLSGYVIPDVVNPQKYL